MRALAATATMLDKAVRAEVAMAADRGAGAPEAAPEPEPELLPEVVEGVVELEDTSAIRLPTAELADSREAEVAV